MSCPNCKLFHKECRAQCCGPVPIPIETYNRNKHLMNPVVEVKGMGDHVLPITENFSCPFVAEDYSCKIYAERPPVCKKFGDESDLLMTCLFQTKEGNVRNNMHRKRLKKETSRRLSNFKL